MNQHWSAVCDDNLPPLNEIVWLYDGQHIWIGGRADDCDGWLWGNTYGTVWHNGAKWDGELETDDDYKPTHWMRLPEPPNAPSSRTQLTENNRLRDIIHRASKKFCEDNLTDGQTAAAMLAILDEHKRTNDPSSATRP